MRVREIMTKSVLTAQPGVPVGKAAELLAYRGFSAMPVVDENGDLIGIVSEADLIRNRFPGAFAGDESVAPERRPAKTVGEVMTSPVTGVSHDADVSELAKLMVDDKRRCVPIVDGRRLVGVVTRRDMLRMLSRSDSDVATDVRRHLQVLGGQARWTVQVVDGDATIRDEFDEASDRHVAQVLAEAVPGVLRATVLARDAVPSST
jgi:CBS domain-containing protein